MINLKKISLTIGIAILFALFIGFTIDAIYPSPKYENYCTPAYYPQQAKLSEPSECKNNLNNEAISNTCYKERGEIRYDYDSDGCPSRMYCDLCSADFNNANDKYSLILFYITALIGIIAIIIGLFMSLSIEAIASGLIFGGILTLLQGTVRVFGTLGKYSKPIMLGIELAIILLIAYKKRDENLKDKKKRR